MKRLALIFLFLFSSAARADDLVSGLSQDQIEITSNYNGTDMVVFGAIEMADTTKSVGDVVVVVRGPLADMSVRRKARIAGLWINRDEMSLSGLPAYYFVASSRPLKEIASADTLRRYQIGLDYLEPARASTHTPSKAVPFIKAAVQERENESLYGELPNGVEFLSYSLFRVRVPFPANVPQGQYTAEVYLFRDGNVMSAQSTPLFVNQIGVERKLYTYAQTWPLVYGLMTVLIAVLLGWISSLMFRQR